VTKYVIRRLIQAIPVLFGITIVVYGILLAAPGGPTARFANNPRVTLADREAFKKAWGLDQPIPVQYCRWLGACNPDVADKVFGIFPSPAALLGPKGWPNFLPEGISGGTNGVLHADFGVSVDSGEPVGPRIIRAALPTLILASFALVIWIGVAILIGVYAAVRRYSLFDQVATIFAYVGYAMPTFWLGIMLIFLFSGPGLNILPAGGMTTTRISPPFGSDDYWVYFGHNPFGALIDIGRHLILPVFTLVVVNIAGDSRFIRASMLEALSQDYVGRPRPRDCRAVGHVQARAPERPPPRRDEHRPGDPVPVHRRDRDGDDLLVARDRQADDRCHPRVRLSDADGPAPDHVGPRRRRQPDRRRVYAFVDPRIKF